MSPTFLRRTLLILMVIVAGCAVVFPPEHGPVNEMLRSRYVTDEQRKAHADLNSVEMNTAIEVAKKGAP